MNHLRTINISLEMSGALISFLIIIFLLLSQRTKAASDRFFVAGLGCNVVVLFSDALAGIYRGDMSQMAYYILRIVNFMSYAFNYLLVMSFTEYFVSFLKGRGQKVHKKYCYYTRIGAVIAIALLIISQFNHMFYVIDEKNLYQRQGLFWIAQIYGLVGIIVDTHVVYLYREGLTKKEVLLFTAYIFLPLVGLILQAFIYGIALLYITTNVVSICIYMFIQVEQSRQIIEKELELEKNRTLLMLSQIKPHFLYNVLGSIGYLCHDDPERAEAAVNDLSVFLRGKIDAISHNENISFERELLHTEKYLALEKMRYGEDLRIHYEIKATQFELPPLTLQPIVENAVRYGVTKREEGGTVTIISEETEEAFLIKVIDDGVGFDTQVSKKDERAHIGMENVTRRLEAQCHGTIEVESVIGKGTEVTIRIPKENIS